MYELGKAGAFVSAQHRRLRGKGARYAAGAAVSAIAAVCSILSVPLTGAAPLRALAAVVGVGAIAGCWYAWTRSVRFLRQAGRASVGARSEREVRSAVRRTGAIAAAYGLVLGNRGGDCDAVVCTGGLGVAAVEVKTGHGIVVVEGDLMRVGRRVLPKSPVRQAAGQARKLSGKLADRAVLAVVCVPGMTNRPFSTAGVWVCSAKDLKTVLDRAPRVFGSAAEAQADLRRLWQVEPS